MTANRDIRCLRAAINDALNMQEQVEFARIINSYVSSDSISELVSSLVRLLDTPAKRQLFGKLRDLIPLSQVAMYDQLLERNLPRKKDRVIDGLVDGVLDSWSQSRRLGASSGSTLDRFHMSNHIASTRKTKSLPQTVYNGTHSGDPFSSSSLPNWEAGLISLVHMIRIDRSHNDPSCELGLSIRGGAEHGLGIYISSVDENSVAQRHGLLPGDQIVAVNGISFKHITNNEAVQIISSSRQLDFEVCHVGRVPGAYETLQEYTWADGRGRMTSPPPEVDLSSRYEAAEERKSGLMLLRGIDERKVNLSVGGSRSMGVMVRGGKEFGLGIYISGVDPGSAAHHAGLKIGDQILDVNGISFLDILHKDAVSVLKSSKRLMLTVKDVGKVPYAMTTYDHMEWIRGENLAALRSIQSGKSYSTRSQILDKYGDSENSIFTRGLGSQLMLSMVSGQASQMAILERRAEQLLTKKELANMKHYLSEYQKSIISVDQLLMALYQLLDTKAKLSLMAQIRGLIAPKDLDDFDVMTVHKESKASVEGQSLTAQFPLHDSSALHSLSSITSSSYSPQNSSNAKVADEMEPLRQAIREIYDFDGNLAPMQKKSPWQPSPHHPHHHQLQNVQYSVARTSQTNGISGITVVAEVHQDARNHQHGKSLKNVEHMDKAVATDDDDNSSKEDPFYLWKTSSNETKNDKNSSEIFETLQILPYYAQVHLRAVRTRTQICRDQDGSHLLCASNHTDSTVQNWQGRTQTTDQQFSSGQKFEGRVANGFKSSRPTEVLDTVYELHHFSDDDCGTVDMLDDEGSAELFVRGSYNDAGGATLTRYKSSEVSVVQSQQRSLEIRNQSPKDIPQPPNPQINGQNAESDRNGKSSIPKEKSGSESEAPVIYAYLHDGDGLSDMAGAASELVDDTLLSASSRKSKSKFNFGRSLEEQDHSSFRQDNPSATQKNHENSEKISRDVDVGQNEKESSYRLKLPPNASSLSQDLSISSSAYSALKAPSGELQLIKVYKTKPTLGMAIEGGANTRQPMPRIAKIQDSGSAYTSDLQEGQVLVAVDGLSLFGLEHKKCAALIAESFKNKSRACLELLILDSNQHLTV